MMETSIRRERVNTSSLCPDNVFMCLSVSRSKTFRVPSAEADTKYLLSCDLATAFTSRVCACLPLFENS